MRDQGDETDDTAPEDSVDGSSSPFEDILATLRDADTPTGPATDPDTESANTDSNPARSTDDRATESRNRRRNVQRRSSAARRRRRRAEKRRERQRKQLALAAALVFGVAVIGFSVGIPAEFALLSSSPQPDAASSSSRGLSAGADSAEVLQVAGPDARYLTRVFTETSNEIAFCGRIETQRSPPVLSFWMADTIESSSTHIQYSSANCPEDYQAVLLHTHPTGSLGLSDQDRSVLTDSELEILCVQNGPLTAEPGDPLRNVACYGEPVPEAAHPKQYHLRLSNKSTNANQP